MKILLQKDLEATLSSTVSKTHLALCSARFSCRVSSTPSALFPQSTKWHSSIFVPAENTRRHLFASVNPTPCKKKSLSFTSTCCNIFSNIAVNLSASKSSSSLRGFSNRTCTYSLCTNLKQISRLVKLVFPVLPACFPIPLSLFSGSWRISLSHHWIRVCLRGLSQSLYRIFLQ